MESTIRKIRFITSHDGDLTLVDFVDHPGPLRFIEDNLRIDPLSFTREAYLGLLSVLGLISGLLDNDCLPDVQSLGCQIYVREDHVSDYYKDTGFVDFLVVGGSEECVLEALVSLTNDDMKDILRYHLGL